MARAKHKAHHHTSHNHTSHRRHRDDHHADAMENGAREAIEAGAHNFHEAQRYARSAFDMFGGPMARLMEHNRAVMQKMFHVMQEESVRFVNRRIEHASQTIEASRDCHGISGLMAVQQEWMLGFARDYADQTRRFAELMGEIVEDGSETLSDVSSEVMERAEEEEHSHAAA